MEAKLREYVESLFRNAPDTPRNREIKEEILQNTLDRFHDDIAGGLDEEKACQRAVSSVGDVESLLEGVKAPKAKKSRTGWTIFAIAAAILILLAVILALNIPERNTREKAAYAPEAANDRVVEWIGDVVGDFLDGTANGQMTGAEISYPDAKEYTPGNVTLQDVKVDALQIFWFAGRVTVEAYDGDEIQVSEESGEALSQEKQLQWLLKDDILNIQPVEAGEYDKLPVKDLTVRLPRKTAEHLRRLVVSPSSAETNITGVKAQTIDLISASGDFHVEAQCTNLRLDAASGNLFYDGAAKNVELDTASGCGELTFEETPKELSFDSASGCLTLFLPEDRSFEAVLDTASGSFKTDFAVTEEDGGTWTYESGSRTPAADLNFDTASGDVEIRKK